MLTCLDMTTIRRKIIEIDDKKCDGCGLCIPNCPEGAIQILDGKARLVSDRFCDGLGACLGHCPREAITVLEREAEPYDESVVMERIVQHGPATIKAHLDHLRDHGETALYDEAVLFLKKKGIALEAAPGQKPLPCGCPGSESREFAKTAKHSAPAQPGAHAPQESALTHWPVQMHLISPEAPQYREKDVLLAADCVAYALGDFHSRHLAGKSLAIACPKLDDNQEIYVEKLRMLIDNAGIKSLHVMIMQVPCCRGLLQLALEASSQASRRIPLTCSVVGLQGEILKEFTPELA